MSLKATYDWYVKAGYLKSIPRDDLTLYNYTTQTVMKGNWNYHTRCARGLILDSEGQFVARPFQKFFGLFEKEETYSQNLPQETAEIATKYDGSLIIVFQNPNLPDRAWDAVTRGCWDNEQIRFTRRWLVDNGKKLEPGYTYCFELIAPWNQIVIPYEEEQMIYLGRVDPYGHECTYAEAQDYALVNELKPVEFYTGRVGDIDSLRIPWDLEGYVARFANGMRVKIKAAHYEERHKEMAKLER